MEDKNEKKNNKKASKLRLFLWHLGDRTARISSLAVVFLLFFFPFSPETSFLEAGLFFKTDALFNLRSWHIFDWAKVASKKTQRNNPLCDDSDWTVTSFCRIEAEKARKTAITETKNIVSQFFSSSFVYVGRRRRCRQAIAGLLYFFFLFLIFSGISSAFVPSLCAGHIQFGWYSADKIASNTPSRRSAVSPTRHTSLR